MTEMLLRKCTDVQEKQRKLEMKRTDSASQLLEDKTCFWHLFISDYEESAKVKENSTERLRTLHWSENVLQPLFVSLILVQALDFDESAFLTTFPRLFKFAKTCPKFVLCVTKSLSARHTARSNLVVLAHQRLRCTSVKPSDSSQFRNYGNTHAFSAPDQL